MPRRANGSRPPPHRSRTPPRQPSAEAPAAQPPATPARRQSPRLCRHSTSSPLLRCARSLSRVDDTVSLPPLLERAAALLDAAGIVLWIADPDGRELNPVLAQGYPQHLVNRLGTIPRNAENATAAAYRTGVLQTVYGDAVRMARLPRRSSRAADASA